jgi:hypothetical protein
MINNMLCLVSDRLQTILGPADVAADALRVALWPLALGLPTL